MFTSIVIYYNTCPVCSQSLRNNIENRYNFLVCYLLSKKTKQKVITFLLIFSFFTVNSPEIDKNKIDLHFENMMFAFNEFRDKIKGKGIDGFKTDFFSNSVIQGFF